MLTHRGDPWIAAKGTLVGGAVHRLGFMGLGFRIVRQQVFRKEEDPCTAGWHKREINPDGTIQA